MNFLGRAQGTLGSTFWRPATALAFPKNTTGIRVHSSFKEENPEGTSGAYAVIRGMVLRCIERDNWGDIPPPLGHGIHTSAGITIENVDIDGFGEDGIHIEATSTAGVPERGNASNCHVLNCNVSHSAGHGVHTIGNEANSCLIHRTSATANSGWGFFDESLGGNTYVACHGESNLGHVGDPGVERSYKTTGVEAPSIFLGCYSEETSQNEIVFPSMALGGLLGSTSAHAPGTSAFTLSGGIAAWAPFVYYNDRGESTMRVDLGANDLDTVALNVLSVFDGTPNSLSLRLLPSDAGPALAGWLSWVWDGGAAHVMGMPLHARPRRIAPLFRQGHYFYSSNVRTSLVSHTAGGLPADGNWEIADLVWRDGPMRGRNAGWVCVNPGTGGTLNGGLTTGTVTIAFDDNLLFVNDATGIEVDQYLKIDGLTDIPRRVVSVSGTTIGFEPEANVDVVDAAVDFYPPDLQGFGHIAGAGELSLDITGGGPITLTEEQYLHAILWTSGTPGGDVDVIYPAPASDADAYEKTIRNTSGQDVIVGTGVGATVRIPDAATVQVGFDATNGAFGITVATSAGSQTIQSAVFTTSGTWTCPAGVTRVELIGFGGGGGGGGGSGGAGSGVLDTYASGGGGGGAALQATTVVDVVPATNYAVTIGAGGAGGSGGGSNSNGTDGGDGQDTTFGTLAAFRGATGGIGGGRIAASATSHYTLACGGGATGAFRPTLAVSFDGPYQVLRSGWGTGGEGTNSASGSLARAGADSLQGLTGGIGGTSGTSSATTYRGGGGGGGGAAGPRGEGGYAGNGGNGNSAGAGSPGIDGNNAGPLGVTANTGGGGGGGGGGGASNSGNPGPAGGDGGDGGSGMLTIVYVS